MSAVIAGCKVNLGLRITGVRPDGYHEIDSLFYPLARPCDQLKLRITETPGIVVRCEGPAHATLDENDNTLTRAYAAFAAAAACPTPGIEVTLRKGIPSGAGLGGGSSGVSRLAGFRGIALPPAIAARRDRRHRLDHRRAAHVAATGDGAKKARQRLIARPCAAPRVARGLPPALDRAGRAGNPR